MLSSLIHRNRGVMSASNLITLAPLDTNVDFLISVFSRFHSANWSQSGSDFRQSAIAVENREVMLR